MKHKIIVLLVLLVLFFIGCADVAHVDPATVESPYGFWGGLWHGMVAPSSIIGSLIFDDIAIYAINNNGGFYDFGFVLGSGILGFSVGSKNK